MITGNFTPSLSSDNATKTLLDMIYRNNALLLNDSISIIGGSFSGGFASSLPNVPLPLIGFVYENPSNIQILKYSYSEYPYLNKSLIVNSYLKENTAFRVVAYKRITAENPVPMNIAMNEILFQTLKKYCDNGGTFTIMTMWGAFSNLVLEELNGVPPQNNETGGCGFEFVFKRLNFSLGVFDKIVSEGLSKMSGGLI